MDICLEEGCDYYFVADCDNILTPPTLEILLNEKKPMIAPMLKPFPLKTQYYSNFFAKVNSDGFYLDDPDYFRIRFNQITGTFKVPLIHCTYLIESQCLNKLRYWDKTETYEFVILAKWARMANIDQYISNLVNFGWLFHPPEDVSYDEETDIFEKSFVGLEF